MFSNAKSRILSIFSFGILPSLHSIGTNDFSIPSNLPRSSRISAAANNFDCFKLADGLHHITILFGESTANIAGHLHERSQEALLTGVFNPKEITQAIDNYADLNNNQWGQAFGKEIMSELNIGSSTTWTAEITSGVLNKLQTKLSDTMGVKFKGVYKKGDKFVKDLTNFINKNK